MQSKYAGGALALTSLSGSVLMASTNVTNCSSFSGGALYLSGSKENLTIEGVVFSNLEADKGGAVYLDNPESFGKVEVANTRFSDIAANQGAGLYMQGLKSVACDLTIQNSVLERLDSSQSGAALYLNNIGKLQILGSTFREGRLQIAAHIYLYISKEVAVVNTTFSDFQWENEGYALALRQSEGV